MFNCFHNVIDKVRSIIGSNAISMVTDDGYAELPDNDARRLAGEYTSYDILKLHFGCGPRILKGWINIDLSFEPYENYLKYYTDEYYPENIRGTRSDLFVFDITKSSLPLPNNSVDLIFHEDFIEHLSQKNQVIFLSECYRVLKPGSIHRINTPDLLVSMREKSDLKGGRSYVFQDEWDKNGHLNVLTQVTLEEMALMSGYSRVVFGSRNCSISHDIPLEYRPDPHDRNETGNIFADLIK